MAENENYNKRPLWQWVLIYVVIAVVVYGLIYYFVLGKKAGTTYNPVIATPSTNNFQTASPSVIKSEQTITLTANGFSPQNITIKTGEKVTWINKSGSDATVDSSPHPSHTDYSPLNLGVFPDGGSLSLTFDKAGTYKYHNHLDPSQFSTIVVQ